MPRRKEQRSIEVNGRDYTWLRGHAHVKISGGGFSAVHKIDDIGDVVQSDEEGHFVVVSPKHIREAILKADPAQIGAPTNPARA